MAIAAGACGHGDPAGAKPATSAFGDLASPLPPVDWEATLGAAREIVSGGGSGRSGDPTVPGRRVFLLVQQRDRRIVTTALRGTLADSVQAAALEAAPQLERGSPFHLELDVAVGEEVYWPVGPGSERAREGLDAIALAPDVGHVGAVLPTELVVDQDFTAGPRPALDIDQAARGDAAAHRHGRRRVDRGRTLPSRGRGLRRGGGRPAGREAGSRLAGAARARGG